jgi:hypothetical protein
MELLNRQFRVIKQGKEVAKLYVRGELLRNMSSWEAHVSQDPSKAAEFVTSGANTNPGN